MKMTLINKKVVENNFKAREHWILFDYDNTNFLIVGYLK